MRLFLVLFFVLPLAAAEPTYCQLTLDDGRILTGLYNADLGVLALFGDAAKMIKVDPASITGRKEVERPAGAPTSTPDAPADTAKADEAEKAEKADKAAATAAALARIQAERDADQVAAWKREVAECDRKLLLAKANALRQAKAWQEREGAEGHSWSDTRTALTEVITLRSGAVNTPQTDALAEVQKLLDKRNRAYAHLGLQQTTRSAADYVAGPKPKD